jgi:hypothetical protein
MSHPGRIRVLRKALTNLYGDLRLELPSERSLNYLTQAGSVIAYTTEFQQLRQYIKWNETALIGRYYNGLHDNTEDEIMQWDIKNCLISCIDSSLLT